MKPGNRKSLLTLALALALPATALTASAAAQDQTTQQLDNQQSTGQTTDPIGTTGTTNPIGTIDDADTTDTTGATLPPPAEGVASPPLNPEVNAMTRQQPPPREPTRGDDRTSQRGVWQALDTDGDGRISQVEAGSDADFQSNFEMMDGDSDGYVSETEQSSHAGTQGDADDGVQQDGTQMDRDDDWKDNEPEEVDD